MSRTLLGVVGAEVDTRSVRRAGWDLVLQHPANLLTELGRVGMAVDRDGVLSSGTKDFVLLTCDREGAPALAGEISAISNLAHARPSVVV